MARCSKTILELYCSMRTFRTGPECHNCGKALTPSDNYCPACGQENDEKNVSLAKFAADLAKDALSLDSRLGRTLIPFLFRPGYLTTEFISGRRRRYVPPLRLYLFASFVFFLTANLNNAFKINSGKNSKEKSNFEINFSDTGGDSADEKSYYQPDSDDIAEAEHAKIDSAEPAGKVKSKVDAALDSLNRKLTAKEKSDPEAIQEALQKRIARNYKNNPDDTLNKSELEHKIRKKLHNRLGLDSNGIVNPYIVQQCMKFNADSEGYFNFLRQNIPRLFFFLVPVFAFILMLLFIRSRKYYIEHFIFVMHVQAFFFIMLTAGKLVKALMGSYASYAALTACLVYLFVALKKNYNLSNKRTVWKLFLFTGVSGVAMVFCMVLYFIVTILTY